MLVLEMSGDAPRKVLKIDTLRLHFDALSEQHRQGRQVIRAGMKPSNSLILRKSSNLWKIKISFKGS